MTHEEFRAGLETLVDGRLSGAGRLEMESHAAQCPACARELHAALELQAGTRALPRSVSPPRDLWPGLEARLRRESAAAPRPRPLLARRTVWALAATLAAAALLAPWIARAPRPVSAPAGAPEMETLAALVSGLDRECMGAGQTLQAACRLPAGPAAAAAATSLAPGLTQGISILDASIAETLAALAADPANAALQRMLAVRYQHKLALLHGAARRVEAT